MFAQAAVDTVTQSPALAGAIIPVLVSLVAKQGLDSRAKALIAAMFAIGAALYTTDGVVDRAMLEGALNNLFMAVAAYKSVWEHLGINDKLLPGVGIGKKPDLVEPGDPDWIPDNFEGA